MADRNKEQDAIDMLVEAAQALGYWATLRSTSQETIDYWTERKDRYTANLKSLHADIIDQGRKVQIASSGESKYGSMSAGEYIEWALGKLEGR